MRTFVVSLRAIVIFTLLTGVLYPLAVTLFGRVLFARNAGGSLVEGDGRVLGSELLGQPFIQTKYFWPRPSAVNYDPALSGATNWSLTSESLVKAVREREAQGAVAEMRYSSASGLDPHISVEAAKSQISRISQARGLSAEVLGRLVASHTEGRQFGFLGQVRVNVLLLNLALDGRVAR